jgi:hypothetical protein
VSDPGGSTLGGTLTATVVGVATVVIFVFLGVLSSMDFRIHSFGRLPFYTG